MSSVTIGQRRPARMNTGKRRRASKQPVSQSSSDDDNHHPDSAAAISQAEATAKELAEEKAKRQAAENKLMRLEQCFKEETSCMICACSRVRVYKHGACTARICLLCLVKFATNLRLGQRLDSKCLGVKCYFCNDTPQFTPVDASLRDIGVVTELFGDRFHTMSLFNIHDADSTPGPLFDLLHRDTHSPDDHRKCSRTTMTKMMFDWVNLLPVENYDTEFTISGEVAKALAPGMACKLCGGHPLRPMRVSNPDVNRFSELWCTPCLLGFYVGDHQAQILRSNMLWEGKACHITVDTDLQRGLMTFEGLQPEKYFDLGLEWARNFNPQYVKEWLEAPAKHACKALITAFVEIFIFDKRIEALVDRLEEHRKPEPIDLEEHEDIENNW